MSFTLENKPRTLVEQKRLQWAKEREEMANLCAPWGPSKRSFDKSSDRSHHLQPDPSTYYPTHRNSLPPIMPKTEIPSTLPHNDSYDRGGETSGYASDCAPQVQVLPQHGPNNNSEMWPSTRRRSSGIQLWARDVQLAATSNSLPPHTPDSISTRGAEERLRWGDRGVGVGHLWEPHEVDDRPPLVKGGGSPPGWLQRGLRDDNKVLIINHGSEKENSSEDTESGGGGNRTYIRGQNIPIDATILAERELKRQRALEHQNAIRLQLEEREKFRKEEHERRLREEREEEERIRRECELERERVLAEEKHAREKLEWEQKRNEMMKQAIEDAERAAEVEKMKHRKARIKREIDQCQISVQQRSNSVNSRRNANVDNENSVHIDSTTENNTQSRHSPELVPLNNTSPMKQAQSPKHHKQQVMPVQPSPRVNLENIHNAQIVNNNPLSTFNPAHQVEMPSSDALALILQPTGLDGSSLSNIQFALLMTPQQLSLTSVQNAPVSVAIPLTGRSTDCGSTANSREFIEYTENRVLTPTKYRTRGNCRESSTQTDKEEFVGDMCLQKELKYGSLDRQRIRRSRKEHQRMRSEERSIEERPKWGVNRPPKQYLTQSEKDPLYQRRKLRQKMRQLKMFEDTNNNYSSDESRSPSPINRGYSRKNLLQSQWQRNEKMYMRNINLYQTEIMPLESDYKGRLFVAQKNVARRQSISEKFLVAKQKNTYNKNENDENTDMYADVRKSRHDKQKKWNDDSPPEMDGRWDGKEVMNQLTNLREGLIQKQQQWQTNSRPSVSPRVVNVESDVF